MLITQIVYFTCVPEALVWTGNALRHCRGSHSGGEVSDLSLADRQNNTPGRSVARTLPDRSWQRTILGRSIARAVKRASSGDRWDFLCKGSKCSSTEDLVPQSPSVSSQHRKSGDN